MEMLWYLLGLTIACYVTRFAFLIQRIILSVYLIDIKRFVFIPVAIRIGWQCDSKVSHDYKKIGLAFVIDIAQIFFNIRLSI